jgi:copper chaperone CopZ
MDESCHVEPIIKTASADQIRKADHVLLAVWGMDCENCATRVRNSLLSLDGVYAVQVYPNKALAGISFDHRKVSALMLLEAVSRAGNDGCHIYTAQLIRP